MRHSNGSTWKLRTQTWQWHAMAMDTSSIFLPFCHLKLPLWWSCDPRGLAKATVFKLSALNFCFKFDQVGWDAMARSFSARVLQSQSRKCRVFKTVFNCRNMLQSSLIFMKFRSGFHSVEDTLRFWQNIDGQVPKTSRKMASEKGRRTLREVVVELVV